MSEEIQGGPSEADKEFKAPITEIKLTNPTNMPEATTPTTGSIHEAVETFLEEREKEIKTAKKYSSELLEIVKTMKQKPATFEELNAAMAETIQELKQKDPEKSGMLERRLNDTDTITGIPKRDSQQDNLRSEIFERVKGENRETTSKTLGIVSFDLRSLKLLNDAVSDHKVGDEYLRRVAEKAEEVSKKVAELLGVDFTISRDGGDEFSAVFTSENINLEQNLAETNPELKELLENLLKNKPESGKTRIIDIISQYLEQEIGADTHNDLFLEGDEKKVYDELIKNEKITEAKSLASKQMKIKLEKFVNKGIDDPELHFKMPENFDLHSYVAAGGSTLYETLNSPDKDDYKTYEEPKSELHALSLLAGAMRARSDKESYRQKDLQNKEISENKNEINEFRMGLLSRNEFTRSIIVEKKKLQIELNKCLRNN